MLARTELFQSFIQYFHLPAVRFRDAAVWLQRRVPGDDAALCQDQFAVPDYQFIGKTGLPPAPPLSKVGKDVELFPMKVFQVLLGRDRKLFPNLPGGIVVALALDQEGYSNPRLKPRTASGFPALAAAAKLSKFGSSENWYMSSGK